MGARRGGPQPDYWLQLFDEIHMPRDLLPLEGLEEVGYNRTTTGFVWLRQKKRQNQCFRQTRRNVSYEKEVTAFVEDRRMRRLTGVNSKELFIWVTICDTHTHTDERDQTKITFATPTGLSRTFPISAF